MTDLTRLITSLKRRSAHAKEFGDSITFVKLEDIDALVEALEKAQQHETQASEMAVQLSTRLTAAEKRATELDAELEREREKSRRVMSRIAELESRTVTVKLPKRSVGEVMHMSGFSRDYAEGWCSGNDNAIHEMRAAGIKVEAE